MENVNNIGYVKSSENCWVYLVVSYSTSLIWRSSKNVQTDMDFEFYLHFFFLPILRSLA